MRREAGWRQEPVCGFGPGSKVRKRTFGKKSWIAKMHL